MKKITSRSKLVLVVICLLMASFNAFSAREEKPKATGAIDAKTFEKLMKAQELTEAGNHAEALAVLDILKNRGKVNGYGKSQMWNFYAFIYASNFSLGVNIFFELNKTLAKMMTNLSQYNVNLEEIHHTQKLHAIRCASTGKERKCPFQCI